MDVIDAARPFMLPTLSKVTELLMNSPSAPKETVMDMAKAKRIKHNNSHNRGVL